MKISFKHFVIGFLVTIGLSVLGTLIIGVEMVRYAVVNLRGEAPSGVIVLSSGDARLSTGMSAIIPFDEVTMTVKITNVSGKMKRGERIVASVKDFDDRPVQVKVECPEDALYGCTFYTIQWRGGKSATFNASAQLATVVAPGVMLGAADGVIIVQRVGPPPKRPDLHERIFA